MVSFDAALAAPDDGTALTAWLMDPAAELPGADPRLDHQLSPPQAVDAATLRTLGVLSWRLPVDAAGTPARLAAIRAARGYNYADAITLDGRALEPGAYAAKLAMFYAEHLHSDEEVRYVTGGCGFFDVRGGAGEAAPWVRIRCAPGDCIVLPAGCYHRFTPDAGDLVAATRLFQGEPVWLPIAKGPEGDGHAARAAYLAELAARG